jgi:hypothetical protein
MATGYTDKVRTGEMTSFKDFAYRCTRAMGIAVMQRDDSLDVPLKEEYEPRTEYAEKALNRQYTALIEAVAWSPEEAEARAKASYNKIVEEHEASRIRREADVARYQSMLDKVRAWTPPTNEHQNLKTFMTEQLEESIKFDGPSHFDSRPVEKLDGEKYRQEEIASAQRMIKHYAEDIEKELERAKSHDAWIAAFKESMKNVD